MNIYLVRHGKSIASEVNSRQTPNTPLGEEGKKQAEAAGNRLKTENIDLILSSKWLRAKQTAEIIANKLSITSEEIEGIHEKEQNPILYGIPWTNQEHIDYEYQVNNNGTDLDWKYKGSGESLRDVIVRANKLKNDLTNLYQGQNIIVVTHGIFIRCFLSLCLLGDKYTDETFHKIFMSMKPSNTGISLLKYTEENKAWKLEYYNDHLHTKNLKTK